MRTRTRKRSLEFAAQPDNAFLLLDAISSLFIAVYAEYFHEAIDFYNTGISYGLFASSLSAHALLHIALVFVVAFVCLWCFFEYGRSVLRFLYKHRYGIGIVIVVLCAILGISFSSMSYLGAYVGADEVNGLLFGIPRGIRSDEFMVSTPLFFSQEANGYAPISYLIRGAATDVRIGCTVVSWSLYSLFQPLQWGYLLFGSVSGLSIFFVGSRVACFLVSFECAMLYANKNKWLSATAAVLITFSPFSMWWNSTNFFIFGQGLVLALHYYLRNEVFWQKSLLALLICWLAGCFLFTLYPAWIVPMFYVFAFMGVWDISTFLHERKVSGEDRTGTHILGNILVMVAGITLLASAVAYIFWESRDAVTAMTSTAYPGARFETGGGSASTLFNYIGGLFFPIYPDRSMFNACEDATIFGLFPAGIILAAVLLIGKKKDLLFCLLIALDLLFIIFTCFQVPAVVAKITLMSNVPSYRLPIATGYLDVVLLMRALSLFSLSDTSSEGMQRPTLGVIGRFVVAGLASVVLLLAGYAAEPKIIGTMFGALSLIVLFGFVYCILLFIIGQGVKAAPCLLCLALATVGVSGALVNPVQQGASILQKSELATNVQSIVDSDPRGLWMTVDTDLPIQNLCLAAGAPTINSTNAYPDLERWYLLDSDRQYSTIYNRYAHISVHLSDDVTSFRLVQGDYFAINLNYSDLKTLNVTYVVTKRGNALMDHVSESFSFVASGDGYDIYRVNYDS